MGASGVAVTFSIILHPSNMFPTRHSHVTSVQLSLTFRGQPFTAVRSPFILSLIHGPLCFQEAGHSGTGGSVVHSVALRQAGESAGWEWPVLRGRECQSSGSSRGSDPRRGELDQGSQRELCLPSDRWTERPGVGQRDTGILDEGETHAKPGGRVNVLQFSTEERLLQSCKLQEGKSLALAQC